MAKAKVKAKAKAPKKEFVRISHYGTGKSLESPVILELPSKVDAHRPRVPVELGFALAFKEAYEHAETSTDFQELRADVRELTYRFEHGRIDSLDSWPNQLIQTWRKRGWIGWMDDEDMEHYSGRRTTEEYTFDRLGYLAALAEFDQAMDDSFYTTWMETTRFFTPKRFAIDSAVLLGLTAAAASIIMFGSEQGWAMVMAIGVLFLRFTTKFENLVTPTYLRYYAAEELDDLPVARTKLIEAMRHGLSNEEIVLAVGEAISEARLKKESAELSEQIAEELCAQEAEMEAAAAELNRTPAFAALLGRDHTADPSWEKLEAQRALLTDVRSRARELENL